MKRITRILSSSILLFSSMFAIALAKKENHPKSVEVGASTVSVADLTELQSALITATSSTEIIVTAPIIIESDTNLDGKGATIRVETPYLNEQGYIDESSTSRSSVFKIKQSVNATFENMTIMGGYSNNNAAIYVDEQAVLELRNVHVTRSNRGIYVHGSTLVLVDCDINRNAASYGGGILCTRGAVYHQPGKVIMDRCSLSENRSTATGMGGGAMEIKNGSCLYANNSVISNNSSSEIGGAINCYDAYIYLTNCTITGNVTTKSAAAGGGVGINSSYPFYAINCIASDNYYYNTNDSSLTRSDVGFYIGAAQGYFYNCASSGALPIKTGTPTIVDSNCNIDTSSQTAKYYRNDGVIYQIDGNEGRTPSYSHPGLIQKSGRESSLYVPIKKDGKASYGGIETYFDYSDLNDVLVGYGPSGSITQIVGTGSIDPSTKVDLFYEGLERTAGIIGASGVAEDVYHTVLLGTTEHGMVEGATIYGDSRLESSAVTVRANPFSGYAFDHWEIVGSSTVNASINPYTFSLDEDVVVNAIYAPYRTLTYDLNGGSGTAPTSPDIPEGWEVIIPNNSGFSRTNCKFVCWNTQNDGLGIDYYPADTFVMPSVNTVLYAKWEKPSSLIANYSDSVVVGNKIEPASLSISALFSDSSNQPVNPLLVSYYLDSELVADPINYEFEEIKTYTIEVRYLGLSTTFDVAVIPEAHLFSYDANGGSGTLPSSSSHYVGDTIIVKNGSEISKTNCKFICWNTQNDGLGTNYYPGDTFIMGASATVLYAKWELPTTLTATYSGDLTRTNKINKSNLSVFVTFADSSSEPVNLSSVVFSVDSAPINLDEYEFDVAKTYDVVASYLGLTAHLNVLVNPIQYTVSFNANSGSGSQESVLVTEDSSYSLPSTTFVAPANKHFAGWSYTDDGDVISSSSITVTGNVALYAKWEVNEFEVYFASGEATSGSIAPSNAVYNEEFILPDASTFVAPTGKFFVGYNVTGEAELKQPGDSINVLSDVVITPIFEKVTLVLLLYQEIKKQLLLLAMNLLLKV